MLVLHLFLTGNMSENVTELFFNVECTLKVSILECTEMCFTNCAMLMAFTKLPV